jgi:hypothetical protein
MGGDRVRPVARDEQVNGVQHFVDRRVADGGDPRSDERCIAVRRGDVHALVELVDADRQDRILVAGLNEGELVTVALAAEHCPHPHQSDRGPLGCHLRQLGLVRIQGRDELAALHGMERLGVDSLEVREETVEVGGDRTDRRGG